MLILVTGTPGAGKTLFTLKWAKEHRDRDLKDGVKRQLWFHDVKGIDHSYFESADLEDVHDWYNCPDGSIIVIDEAHERGKFPQRPAGRDVPDWVEEMATHRHKGMDIYLITQNAAELDIFIRRRCGKHLHIERLMGQEMATVYEYSRYVSDPLDYHAKKSAVNTTPARYPKEIYSHYKSAEIHTVRKRIPAKAYLLILLPLLIVGLLGLVFSRFSDRMEEADSPASAPSPPEQTNSMFAGNEQLAPSAFTQAFLQLFQPEVIGVPESAPIYRELVKASVFPKPWCLVHEDSCHCYTQQITRYETTDQACRYYVEHGWFDYTLEEMYEGGGAGGQAQRPSAPPTFTR